MNPPDGHEAQYLTIHYRSESQQSIPLGVALYIPSLNALYFRFRTDLDFASEGDAEILAGTADLFHALAREQGAAAAFEWLNTVPSNAVFVEGPGRVVVRDSVQSVEDLFNELFTTPPRYAERSEAH
jgi:hypothetical protein